MDEQRKCIINTLIVCTYLYSGFGKVDFERHFLSHEYVRVPGFAEQRFQHFQLCARERRPLSSLLPRVHPCKQVKTYTDFIQSCFYSILFITDFNLTNICILINFSINGINDDDDDIRNNILTIN